MCVYVYINMHIQDTLKSVLVWMRIYIVRGYMIKCVTNLQAKYQTICFLGFFKFHFILVDPTSMRRAPQEINKVRVK